MKLRNKKTGEIPEKIENIVYIRKTKMIMMVYINNDGNKVLKQYDSLETFNEEWEDYKEPKNLWFIAHDGSICSSRSDLFTEEWEELGLTFETKEECERAVEKLKAWKRLKDKKFKFDGYDVANRAGDNVICGQVYFKAGNYDREEIKNDLDLLFGGEE